MKCLIIYFSATGNTAHGAHLVRRGIEAAGHSCDLVTARDFRNEMLAGYDLIGFAAPVFAFKPALPLLDIVERLPKANNRPCFTFFSLGGDLVNALRILQKGLMKKGYAVLAHHEMLAEDSWTTIRGRGAIQGEGHPTPGEQEAAVSFGSHLPDALNAYMAGGHPEPTVRFWAHPYHLVSYFYNYPVLSRFFVTRVNPESCIRCGLCVAQCPTGRMRFDRFPNPRGKCSGCYGCINACPQNAIEGWLTRGKARYRGLSQRQRI